MKSPQKSHEDHQAIPENSSRAVNIHGETILGAVRSATSSPAVGRGEKFGKKVKVIGNLANKKLT
jgi:hypothetical protein